MLPYWVLSASLAVPIRRLSEPADWATSLPHSAPRSSPPPRLAPAQPVAKLPNVPAAPVIEPSGGIVTIRSDAELLRWANFLRSRRAGRVDAALKGSVFIDGYELNDGHGIDEIQLEQLFDGFSSVTGDLSVIRNRELKSFPVMLDRIDGALVVGENSQLRDLLGMISCSTVGRLEVWNNAELTDLLPARVMNTLWSRQMVRMSGNPLLHISSTVAETAAALGTKPLRQMKADRLDWIVKDDRTEDTNTTIPQSAATEGLAVTMLRLEAARHDDAPKRREVSYLNLGLVTAPPDAHLDSLSRVVALL